MGFIPTEESKKMEIEEFKRMFVICARLNGRKDGEEFGGLMPASSMEVNDYGDKLVCVTSGVSFLGLPLVELLFSRGYSIRIIVDNEEDMERLRELGGSLKESDTIETVAAEDYPTEDPQPRRSSRPKRAPTWTNQFQM